ncbi:unnamed protein product [Rotaria sp. Silwood1]|nr:unnamed protein product [Rotaria sp. Silwood1]CAF1666193.1 unnamed protein product [Rotaria sp. Silwood1]CAF3978572.1 unnamed protein product [Rotaria sp. Silwood1]CAF4983575.1 unnamed protein product [Rotaria sp. Silwood1]
MDNNLRQALTLNDADEGTYITLVLEISLPQSFVTDQIFTLVEFNSQFNLYVSDIGKLYCQCNDEKRESKSTILLNEYVRLCITIRHHPDLQEVCSERCDTGRPIVDLKRTFPLLIKEFNTFEQTFGDIQWRDKLNSESFYLPNRIEERAKAILQWLINRSERNIVVISYNLMLKAIFQLHNQLINMKNGEIKMMV